MNDKQEFWDKEFNDKPPSAILPIKHHREDCTVKELVDIYAYVVGRCDPHMHFYFRKGMMSGQGNRLTDDEYTKLLDACISTVFDMIRQDIDNRIENMEEKQELLQTVSAAQSIFKSGTAVLNSLNLKLDINLAASILHGYTLQCIRPKIESYEDRKNTGD